MSDLLELVDTTTRDGNQSIWSATGLTTLDVLRIAPVIDRVGYRALDFTSSTHMAISVRYHREDPWQRIRLVAAAMPRTPLTFLTTGTRFISWRPAGDDVMDLVFRCAMRNGLRRVQIADPTNDPARLVAQARLAKAAGAEEVVVALTYSVSPVHTDEWYAARLPALAASRDIDRVYIKDPGGLLVPERVRSLYALLAGGLDGRPVEVHSHCTTSVAPLVYVEALRAGCRTLHTAVRPLANGTSQPPAETTIANARELGLRVDVDEDALAETSEYFRRLGERKGLPLGAPVEYDLSYYRHQLPGGMATTMRRNLEEMRRPDLLDAALEEVERVRAELGWPIMVTPFSQFVGTQAVLNVLSGKRYASVPDEVVRYLIGQFGAPSAPPDPDVAERILSRPRARELARVEPLSLEGARARFGARISDEELLLRLTMPAEQVDAMLASAPATLDGAADVGRRAPVVELLDELRRRPNLTYVRVDKDGEVVEWRRSGSAGAAG